MAALYCYSTSRAYDETDTVLSILPHLTFLLTRRDSYYYIPKAIAQADNKTQIQSHTCLTLDIIYLAYH